MPMQPDEPANPPVPATYLPELPRMSEPPRLGIFHLLALTACVAAYIGVRQAFWIAVSRTDPRTSPVSLATVEGALSGIGGGAALAGVVLFVVRRSRLQDFPVYPGEYMLVLMGFNALIPWMGYTSELLVWMPTVSYPCFVAALVFGPSCLVFLWAMVGVQARRWQVFLLAIPGSYLLAMGPAYAGAYSPQIGTTAARGLILVALAAVLLRDRAGAGQYPWTHWFGVGTRFWLDASAVGVGVWQGLFAA
jgi:hypothetical protein